MWQSLFIALAVVLSGCAGSASDKAGNVSRSTTVLTLANPLGSTNELQAFADEVAKRSDGTLRIRFVNEWRHGQRDYESRLVRDVAAGKADLGWVGSRAWNTLGIHDFDALTAPFAIDSYELERAVLESDLSDDMLRSIEGTGVVGLGILPGPLRYLLATPRPLLRPSDVAGLRVGYQRGAARDTLLALGATPVVMAASAPWRGIDAIETQVGSIATTGYDRHARHLTANVPLWPRPLVLFAGKATMARLSAAQRALLRDAARAAVAGALKLTRAHEHDSMASLCRRGIDAAQASEADRAALRDAVAPVLESLRRDPGTRSVLQEISAMRKRTDAEPPLSCSGKEGASTAGLPDGTYTTRVTHADIRASGADRVLTKAEIEEFVRSTFKLVLDAGTFALHHDTPEGPRGVIIEGKFSVYRDRFVATGNNDDVVRARFSFDGTTLIFEDVSAVEDLVAIWASHPWKPARPR